MIENNKTQNSLYGVIIKVENIDVCRSFYRDVLELGAPVIDSNFWVEFKLQEDVSIVLEQAPEGEKIPPGRDRVSWLYRIDHIEEMLSKLKEHGHQPHSEEERLGYKVYQFLDPEGNPFYLYSAHEDKK
jgi:predicted enzyme related to lactoylglutathione lyase